MQCSLTKLYTNDPTDPACLVRVLLGAIDSHEASTATYLGFPIGFPHRLLGHLSALMLAGGVVCRHVRVVDAARGKSRGLGEEAVGVPGNQTESGTPQAHLLLPKLKFAV